MYNVNTKLIRRLIRCVRCIARLSRCSDIGAKVTIVPVTRCLGLVAAINTSKTVCNVLLTFNVLFPGDRVFMFPVPFPIGTGCFIVKCTTLRVFLNLNTSASNITRFTRLKNVVFNFVLVVC